MNRFRIGIEWLHNAAIAVPEERALFGRLTVYAGDDCLTVLNDSWHRALASGPYISVHSLANWIVANWWPLLYEPLRQSHWSEEFLRRHGWETVSGPYSLPRLVAWRDEDRILLRLARSSSRFQEATFLTSGDWDVSASDYRAELSRFIDCACDRLEELGFPDDPLLAKWREIGSLTPEETEFCVACGRLGINPDLASDTLAEGLLAASAHPILSNEELAEQFFASESSDNDLCGDANLIADAVEKLPGIEPVSLAAHWFKGRNGHGIAPDKPWEFGYQAARELRGSLGLTDDFVPPDLTTLFGWSPSSGLSLPLAGVALVSCRSSGETRIGTRVGHEFSKRFAYCRGLFDALAFPRALSYVASGFQLREKASRAFAAEFLLPAAALRSEVSSPAIDADWVNAIASKYRVSSKVVYDQARNHGVAELEEAI